MAFGCVLQSVVLRITESLAELNQTNKMKNMKAIVPYVKRYDEVGVNLFVERLLDVSVILPPPSTLLLKISFMLSLLKAMSTDNKTETI